MSTEGRSGTMGVFVTHPPGKRVDAIERVDSSLLRPTDGGTGINSASPEPYAPGKGAVDSRRLRTMGAIGEKSESPYSGTDINAVDGPELKKYVNV